MRVLKKISTSTVFGRVTAEMIKTLKEEGTEIFVGRFYGVANDFATGQTQFGVWTALVGSFRAVDGGSGEVCQGPTLLLPMGICEQVAIEITAQKKEGKAPSIALSADIYIKHRVIAGEDKYEYIARTGEVAQPEDPLEIVARSLGEMPMLGAHAKQPQLENNASDTVQGETVAETVSAKNASKKK